MLNNKFGVDEALRELGDEIVKDMQAKVPRISSFKISTQI